MPSIRSYLESAREYALDTAKTYRSRAALADRIEAFHTFGLALKMIAFARLLLESDVPAFFNNLHHVAANGKRLLEMVRDEPGGGARIPASRNDPLLSALVTDPGLARGIAALSTRELVSPEYDDEFYGARFLQEAVLFPSSGPPSPELEGLFQKIDDYLEQGTARTQVFRALARRDWKEFESAFRTWNEESADELEEAADNPGATYSMGLTKHIWLEGLAVIKLAEHHGFRVEPTFRPKLPGLILESRPALSGVPPLLLGIAPITQEDL